jgi:5-formyltetrahydrofolate cyclo-ligase
MLAMSKDKDLIRLWLKSKRMKMTDDEVLNSSRSINDRLIKLLSWNSFKNIHCYEEIRSLNEVSTSAIRDYLANRSNITLTKQDKGKTLPIPDKKYDLILVPTLGFDTKGNRIGWGGGYYDRLLSTQRSALKIGLCFQSGFVIKGLPPEPHDVNLNIVITETKIYKFNF